MNPRIIVLLTAALCAVTITLGVTRLNKAEAQVTAATSRLALTQTDAQRVLDLRVANATVSLGKKPEADIIARISDTLAAAGIPSGVRGNVSAGTNTPVATPGMPLAHKQRVRFILKPMTTTQLGPFLDAWETTQSLWTVTQLELTTNAKPTDQTATYAAHLTIEATYLVQDSTP